VHVEVAARPAAAGALDTQERIAATRQQRGELPVRPPHGRQSARGDRLPERAARPEDSSGEVENAVNQRTATAVKLPLMVAGTSAAR
jgi:hypothetical protein